MQYLIYSNPGELDLRALTVMGVNAKPRSESPIGFFGTGLKYAIAVTMRLGGGVFVDDGKGNRYSIIKEHDAFREKEFTFLKLKGAGEAITLPYTTELGKNWLPWMVVRELESNVRDEGGSVDTAYDLPTCDVNTVRIIVHCSEVLSSHRFERDTIFFDKAVNGLRSNEQQMLENAIELCKFIGYNVDKFDIRCVETLPRDVYGMAVFDDSNNDDKHTIYLARKSFEHGEETVAGTLLEEFFHLEYHMTDESRKFQDPLLRQLISVGQSALKMGEENE